MFFLEMKWAYRIWSISHLLLNLGSDVALGGLICIAFHLYVTVRKIRLGKKFISQKVLQSRKCNMGLSQFVCM